MGSVDGSGSVDERPLSAAVAVISAVIVNPLDVAKDSTVRVIPRASLAQRAQREREKLGKREWVLLKASLGQLARHKRERFAKRARLERDTIAQVGTSRKQSNKRINVTIFGKGAD